VLCVVCVQSESDFSQGRFDKYLHGGGVTLGIFERDMT